MNTFFSWRQAILAAELPSTTKLVLLVISTYMNDHGTGAFPTTKTIAANAGVSERAVCTHIKKAKEAGFLRVDRHGFGGQKWARNEYQISFPIQPKGTEPVSVSADKGTEPHAEGTEPDDIKALNEVQSNSPYNSPVEENTSPGGDSSSAANSKNNCPHSEILRIWSEIMPEKRQPNPSEWKSSRAAYKHLAQRWKEGFEIIRQHGTQAGQPLYTDKETGLAWWSSLFNHCRKSVFLMNECRPFCLDWLCKRDNFIKIKEGAYHD